MVLTSSIVLPASTTRAAPPFQRPHLLKHAPLLAHYLQERETVQSSPVASFLLFIPLLIIISGAVRLHACLPLKSETAMKEGADACVAVLWRQHLALISMDSIPDCQGLRDTLTFTHKVYKTGMEARRIYTLKCNVPHHYSLGPTYHVRKVRASWEDRSLIRAGLQVPGFARHLSRCPG